MKSFATGRLVVTTNALDTLGDENKGKDSDEGSQTVVA